MGTSIFNCFGDRAAAGGLGARVGVTSRQVVGLFLEHLCFEFVPVFQVASVDLV